LLLLLLDYFIIHNTHIYRRIEIHKNGNQI
jgi:hypothetical protein